VNREPFGTRRLYGGFIGATIYLVVQDYSAKISPFFWEFVVGGLLIATVLLLDGGLLGRQNRKDRMPGGRPISLLGSGLRRVDGPRERWCPGS
jgi:hypothetical protein